MEGPFGLVSSRCLPRWPWSVVVVSHTSGASDRGGVGYRSHSAGASSSSSTNPGTPSRFEKDPSAEGVLRRRKVLHYHREDEVPLHRTHRHVDNAVDKANDAGARERSRSCFPTLRRVCEALAGFKGVRRSRESLNRMSYRERLNYHSKWTEGPRSFEVFLLNAADCPDEVKGILSKDAHQRSHVAQALEAQESQGKGPVGGGGLTLLRNVSPPKMLKHRSRSPSPVSFHNKLGSPPGRSALKSLTPEGVRSRSRSPPGGASAVWVEETSFNGIWSRPSPPKGRALSPKDVARSRSGSPARERITPIPWCRPESPKGPKDVLRPRHQLSTRPHRFESPIRNRRNKNPAGNSEEEDRLRIYRPCSNSGVKSRSGIPSRSVSRAMSRPSGRDQSRPRRRPSPSKDLDRRRSPPPRAQNKPGNEATMSLGGALALPMGDPHNRFIAVAPPSNPATARIKLTNSLGTFLTSNLTGALDAGTLRTTPDRPRLVGNDDTKVSRMSKESRSPQPSPVATRVRVEDPSRNIDAQSASKPEEATSSQASIVGIPDRDTVYERWGKEEEFNRKAESGEFRPESPSSNGGTKQLVDTMAVDVLKQLKEYTHPRGPVRRRAYEVAIPAGVWKLNFIPNVPLTASGTNVSSKTPSSSSSRGKSRGCF